MNITVPTSAIEHFFEEPPVGTAEEFWGFRFRPQAQPGDPIFFRFDGKVIAQSKCSRIERPGESSCGMTGRFRSLWKVAWRVEDFVDMR